MSFSDFLHHDVINLIDTNSIYEFHALEQSSFLNVSGSVEFLQTIVLSDFEPLVFD